MNSDAVAKGNISDKLIKSNTEIQGLIFSENSN